MLQVLDLNVNPAHASAHSSALSGSPLGTSKPRPSSITNLTLPWEGFLTDDQEKDRSCSSSPAPLPATTSETHPSSTAFASATSSTPMLLRTSSSTSSVTTSSSYSSGLATASLSKHHDKRAGAATAATSSSSTTTSSSAAYRPSYIHLDPPRSFTSVSSPAKPPHRVYHGEQAFAGSPSPPPPALGNDSTPDIYCRGTYLLPCPPTSPTGRRTRFRLNQYQSNLRRTVGWVKDRLHAVRSTASMLRMNRSTRQDHRPHPSKHVLPDTSHGRSLSPAFWVVLYFTLNLSLTLYNKYVLIHFPFPYTLTALHALCGTVGTSFMLHLGGMGKPSMSSEESGRNGIRLAIPNLTLKETVVVLLFSLLYTVNIVVSNASLKLVTVPFHQVVRGSTPLFTIALSAVLFNKRSSRAKLVALVPVMAGVGFATYGDYYCTLFGFCLTLLGTVLASFKTVVTHLFLGPPNLPSSNSKRRLSDEPTEQEFSNRHRRIPSIFKYSNDRASRLSATTIASSMVQAFKNIDLPKLSLTPMQLLYLMSPLAFMQTTLLAYFTGELAAVNQHLHAAGMEAASASHSHGFLGWGFGVGAFGVLERMGLGGLTIGMPSGWLIMNGVMAFALNVVSFYANKRIGAVGMSVAANVKQVLTVLCAVVLFDLTITMANGVGIALTLIGGAWYAQLDMKEKAEEKERNAKIG